MKIFKILCLYLFCANAISFQFICESIFPLGKNVNSYKCIVNKNTKVLEFQSTSEDSYTVNIFGSLKMDDSREFLWRCTFIEQGEVPDLGIEECNLSRNVYIKQLFKNMNKSAISSITIKGIPKNITTKEYLDFLALNFPNLEIINWLYCDECLPLNQIFLNYKYLKIIRMNVCKTLIGCQGYDFRNLTQIERLQIIDTSSEINDNKNISFFNETRLKGMNNLKEFELIFPTKGYVVEIPKNIFEGLKNLSKLSIINCSITELTEEHFQDLVNLKYLTIKGGVIHNLDWLKYVFN